MEHNRSCRLYWVISSVVDYPVAIDRLRLIYDRCLFVCRGDLHGSTDDHKGSKDDTMYSRRVDSRIKLITPTKQLFVNIWIAEVARCKAVISLVKFTRYLALNVLGHFKAHTDRTSPRTSLYNLQCNSYHQCSS
jgi:hypothetical protein